MSLTPEQERRIGEIFGYPPCCIDAFIANRGTNQAKARGIIYRPDRSSSEVVRIDAEISLLTGRPHDGSTDNQYVPCESCMGSPGWRPFSEPRPPAIMRWAVLTGSVNS